MNLHSYGYPHIGLDAVGPSSDGTDGIGLPINGYNKVMAIASVGAGFADSDATVTIAFSYASDSIVDSDATYSVDLTASSVTFTPDTADSTGKGGIKVWDFDLVGLGIDTGCLRPTATVSAAGGTVPTAVFMFGYQANKALPTYATSDVAVVNTST
jgi:hypothetical protein